MIGSLSFLNRRVSRPKLASQIVSSHLRRVDDCSNQFAAQSFLLTTPHRGFGIIFHWVFPIAYYSKSKFGSFLTSVRVRSELTFASKRESSRPKPRRSVLGSSSFGFPNLTPLGSYIPSFRAQTCLNSKQLTATVCRSTSNAHCGRMLFNC